MPNSGFPVAIVLGSASDWPVMESCYRQLADLGIRADVRVLSAHRTPREAADFAAHAAEEGYRVLIAAAGLSAALAGTLAAHTTLPVIGVPMAAGPLNGLDALLSTVQMPAGTPVACVAIGEHGARNAAFLAAEILALQDPQIRQRLDNSRRKRAEAVDKDCQTLRERIGLG